jgi:hypothetical protein
VKIFIGVAQGLRLVLVLVLIVSLNFLTFRFFKKRIVKKKQLKRLIVAKPKETGSGGGNGLNSGKMSL